MKHPIRFSVRPRYTPGSPGQVDSEIAMTVASQEKESYEAALTGVFGAAEKLKAETLGLSNIVEQMQERKNGFDIVDMITGENRRREHVKAKSLRVGDTVIGHTDSHSRFKVNEARVGPDFALVWEGPIALSGPLQFRVAESVYVERLVKVDDVNDRTYDPPSCMCNYPAPCPNQRPR